jgi:flavin reductase (DIM6/NTAB) family NADH-FMN oxidoreductase RutF
MESQAAPFDARLFRQALGLFPTGVAIVTARMPDGARLGMTVSSFNAVSLAPPLVLFSVAETARGYAAWATAETFAVSILSEEQADLSTRFAKADTDKWAGLLDRTGRATDAPLIPGALASFECRAFARHPGGDHLIILGEVLALHRRPALSPRPLVFFASRYRALSPEAGQDAPHEIDWPQGW